MLLYVPSRCARDTEDLNSGSSVLAPIFALWVLLSGKPTRFQSSHLEWSKVSWIRVLSSTIWNPSTAARIATEWISSLPVSHAREQASPESDSARPTNDGSGLTSGASRASVELRCCSSRTCPGCSPSTTAKRSRKSSAIWPRAGGLRNGTAFPRDPLAPRTSAIASSCSLPTPTASQYGSSQNGINGRGGANERPSAGTPSLYQLAARGRLPTPTATDCKASGTAGNWTKESGRNSGTTLTN